MSKREVHSSLQPFFLSLSITALYAVLIISVFNIIGFQLTFISTVIGALGVAAGLALSGTLQNFAGGVLILLLKPFGIEDHIIAQGQDGRVQAIQLFYTEILTADNKTVIIPNGKLFNEVIINITRQGKRRLDVDFKLNYGADIEQVKGILTTAIKKVPNIMGEPAVKIGVLLLESDGMRFTVRVWVDPAYFLATQIALQEEIINDVKAAGIKFPGMA
ncbi:MULTISPECIES: mechanosensitive ion channel family protein [unclassified Mucilaginibacter]|uniref:mechanosensitive ion channel family protein n=1 Tax=unclassified Mucilaginibacter TaxID=2617802 RepID=UPI002AC9F061|nr:MULTISPECIES: mechanosensitive ion channel family protein [unclassified Mucilaginibacter]MEB0260484.1 mechanosensitive ion channel family protein [Mucilaginibacter sp. 10I4]MEB0280066.1 mechanosensitive ion channel family protein [Mucilaginibacter sp. 10B2]MEB0302764.1 mechanosensitive ion channel family protein [Mucilaginibacter sp. 5C4]WPX23593.1 mechanosensitive ion channel family protein [Mucilaginibacter sp. 5C4]